ncbi:hypothetical protein TPELB_06070 [Terrisporobacter petrolearius]|uniref:DGC domain-containing protein n=1 Tax=Terrisporobacter petrolearius TaxID=1460447 RepID=A0ABZ3F934_9FIRM
MSKIKVIPCSGIGKVHGAMSREAALETIKKSPQKFEAVCLAHIVTGDKDGKEKVENCDCITIDGCPAMCSKKSVELVGGNIIKSMKVIDEMKKHRGKKPGTATILSEDGWMMVDNMVEEICSEIVESTVEGE